MSEMKKHKIVAELFGKEKLDRLHELMEKETTVNNEEYRRLTDEYNEIWDTIPY